jgi:sulfite oxidase
MGTPRRDSQLTLYQEEPLNAGTPLDRLRRSFVTPVDLFFVRSHGSLPEVDPDAYRLSVTGMVARPLELSLGDLRRRFADHDLTAAVVCAGNRRNELAAVHPLPGEVPWGADAISTARWRGVRLADILDVAGVAPDARHVAFSGMDQARVEDDTVAFGASIPLEKALHPEVLLVHTMNDAPLPREHGFPVRVLVPGYVGARSVKWLRDITVQREPSTNYFEAHDYKWFPPEVTAAVADWSHTKPIEEIPLNAVICTPRDGELRRTGPTLVQGYAIAGEAAPVQRVELSLDGGATWTEADVGESDRWSWCYWEATVDLPRGDREIVVRAWDAAGRTQPADVRSLWNFKGYLNNAWHRVHVTVR